MCSLVHHSPLVLRTVSEGGHHVPSALGHCPAVLLPRVLEFVLSPCVRVEGEHLLQVLKHIVEDAAAAATERSLLKLSPVSVHGLAVGLGMSFKVSLVMSLMVCEVRVGVKVVLLLMLAKMVKVFQNVIKVEIKGLKVLAEVVVATTTCVAAACVAAACVAASTVASSW